MSRTSTTLLAGLTDPQNAAAWRRFGRRYMPMLMSYARRVGLSDQDAQEIVAETLAAFVQAYMAGQYDRDRGRLKSWLKGILLNYVRRLGRQHRMLTLSEDGDGAAGSTAAESASSISAEEAFEHEWRLELLNDALAELRRECDPTTFQAFDLYALKEWPVEKVASFLGMKPATIYVCKTRCIQRLCNIAQRMEAEDKNRNRESPHAMPD